MPKVSVVIPLYNKADSVLRAVTSVLEQSFQDLELIVVDDGSTDGGADTIAGVTDPRVRIVEQENAGPGAARNRGLREAGGEYVTFLDADDEWEPGFLQLAVSRLDAHPECAASVAGQFIGPARVSWTRRDRRLGLETGVWRLPLSAPPKALKSLIDFCHSSCVVARRTLVQQEGGYYDADRCTYGEDGYLWMMFVLNYPLYVDPEPGVWFHTEDSSLGEARMGSHPLRPALASSEPLLRRCMPEYLPALHDLLAYYRLVETEKLMGKGMLEAGALAEWRAKFPWRRPPAGRVAMREGAVSLATSWPRIMMAAWRLVQGWKRRAGPR